jgi:hypothetical protein
MISRRARSIARFGIQPLPDGGCIIGGMTGDDSSKPEFLRLVRRPSSVPTARGAGHHREKRRAAGGHDTPRLPRRHLSWSSDTAISTRLAASMDSPCACRRPARSSGNGRSAARPMTAPTTLRSWRTIRRPIVGYSQAPGAWMKKTGWDLVTYRLSPEGLPMALRPLRRRGVLSSADRSPESRTIFWVGRAYLLGQGRHTRLPGEARFRRGQVTEGRRFRPPAA